MKLFSYSKPQTAASALNEACQRKDARYIGGGTNLIDLMKENVEQPEHLIDVSDLQPVAIETVPGGGIKIGAAVKNSDLADHNLVRSLYPVLSKALVSGASPQLRNMATVAGNIMQRTRCYYFYDIHSACNKRVPGTGCDAIEGYNRMNAVLGGSKHCIAVHPSDMAVAMVCLDAVVHTLGRQGERKIPLVDFYKLPGDTPQIETVLEEHELITALELPPVKANKHWCYLKVRDRASYEFALVSVAAVLELQSGKISRARLALGGVGTKPWRAFDAETFLSGKIPHERVFKEAAGAAMHSAVGYEYNQFKIELGKRTVVRALKIAAGGVV
jgi:xanthine dehydrogenase YagS FAD-binding subunit